MSNNQKPLVLHFHPALECSICGRASNVGTIDNFTAGLVVHCYEHGLVEFTPPGQKTTPYALQEQYAGIERFVIGLYDGYGVATVIGPIEPASIPGYAPPTPSQMERYKYHFEGDESAWIVRYEFEETIKTVYAVWSYDENMFYLYDEEQGLIDPLESEQ